MSENDKPEMNAPSLSERLRRHVTDEKGPLYPGGNASTRNIILEAAAALEASEAEIARLARINSELVSGHNILNQTGADLERRLATAEARATRLEAEAAGLREALKLVRSIIVDANETGFNCHSGNWAERLFASQAVSYDALHPRAALASPVPSALDPYDYVWHDDESSPVPEKGEPIHTEQPGFDYFECPECGFDSIQVSSFTGSEDCPLCAGDSGHDVRLNRRTARTTDKPEGKDARKVKEGGQ